MNIKDLIFILKVVKIKYKLKGNQNLKRKKLRAAKALLQDLN